MPSSSVGSAHLNIVPKFDGLSESVNKAMGGATSAGQKLGLGVSSGVQQGVGGLAASGALVGVFSAVTSKAMDLIASHTGAAVSRLDTMNNYPRVLQSVGVAADEAEGSIGMMSDRLQGLPTRLDTMAATVQGLYAATKDYGVSLTTATRAGLGMNDMLLAGGQNTAVVNAAMEQFRQMLAKGKPDMQDWRSLISAAPGQMDQLAKSMLGATATVNDLYYALGGGKSSDEHLEGIEFASISMSQLLDAIIALDEQGGASMASFREQAEAATDGIETAAENFGNAWTRGIASVMDAAGRENIVAVINDAKAAVNDMFGVATELTGKIVPGAKALYETVKPFAPVVTAGAAAMVGASTAGGTLVQVASRVASGISAAGSIIKAGTTTTNALAKAALAAADGNKAFGVANALLGTSFSPITLGATAAVAAVGALAVVVYQTAEREREARMLSDGLGDSLELVRRSASEAATGFDVSAQTMADAMARAKDSAAAYRSEHEKTVDQVQRSREVVAASAQEYGSTVTALERANKVIQEYTGNSNLSTSQQLEFEAAIRTVNEICGTQLTVIEGTTGAFRDEATEVENDKDAIYEYIRAKEYAARLEAISVASQEANSIYSQQLNEQAALMAALGDSYEVVQPKLQAYFDQYGYGTDALAHYQNVMNGASLADRQAASEFTRMSGELRTLELNTLAAAQSASELAAAEAATAAVAAAGGDAASVSLAQLALASEQAFSAFTAGGTKAELSAVQFAATVQDVCAEGEENAARLRDVMANPEEWSRVVAAYDGTAGSLRQVFQELGIDYDEMAARNLDLAASADDMAAHLMSSLDDNQFGVVTASMGMSMGELSQKLIDAGVNMQTLSKVGSAQFATLASQSGGDIRALVADLESLEGFVLNGKTYYVTDDGTVMDELGAVQELDAQEIRDKGVRVEDYGSTAQLMEDLGMLATTEVPDFEFDVTDGGSTELRRRSLRDLSSTRVPDKSYKVSDGNTTSKLTTSTQTLAATRVADKGYKVSDGGTTDPLASKLVGLRNTAVPNKSFSVSATDYATNTLKSVKSWLDGINSKTITVTAKGDLKTRSATGSVSDAAYIPRHAAGYIATGPTLTNNGWVGEDGDEAVLNWATGGTVVPLTNTRYMRPIASAIAEEMGGALPQQGPSAAQIAEAVVLALRSSGLTFKVGSREFARLVGDGGRSLSYA